MVTYWMKVAGIAAIVAGIVNACTGSPVTGGVLVVAGGISALIGLLVERKGR